MSHFAVMVKIPSGGEDIDGSELMETLEEIMAPYQENNMGDCPAKFMEFNDVEEEEKENWETGTTKAWFANGNSITLTKEQYDELKNKGQLSLEKHDVMFEVIKDGKRMVFHCCDENEGKWSERIYGKISCSVHDEARFYSFDVEKIDPPVDMPKKEKYSDFDEYMKEYCGYNKDEKTGKYGYWENPHAKWDWWQVGGRWAGMLKIKTDVPMRGEPSLLAKDFSYEEGTGDFAKIKDIDFDAMGAKVEKEANEYYDKMERFQKIQSGEIEEDKEKDIWLRLDFGRAVEHGVAHWEGKGKKAQLVIDVSREEFLEKYKYMFEFGTWAVIEKGEWHEKAKMGWWASHDGAKKDIQEFDKSFTKRFLENEDPETYIAIVDCHI